MKAIQDYYSPEFAHCFGCGPANSQGLRLKSHVEGDETVARFVPPAYYTGGFPGHVYGGIIASLLDCHGAASAAAFAHCDRGRSLGDGGPPIRFVTASLKVDYKRPTPLGGELVIRGRLIPIAGRKATSPISARRQCMSILSTRPPTTRLTKCRRRRPNPTKMTSPRPGRCSQNMRLIDTGDPIDLQEREH